jgi:hypothetical protein
MTGCKTRHSEDHDLGGVPRPNLCAEESTSVPDVADDASAEGGVDFAALFRRSDEAREDPVNPDELERPTPRQAAQLHACLAVISDQVRLDIERHRGKPVTFHNRLDWNWLADLPVATWRQNMAWRRRFLACIDDLIGDLEDGEAPIPRCVGEEVALCLAIDEASDWGAEEFRHWKIDTLPEDPDDPDWILVMDRLFQDMDVEMILWPGLFLGGWATPAEVDRHAPIDYLPPAWFEWFLNVEPRPGR